LRHLYIPESFDSGAIQAFYRVKSRLKSAGGRIMDCIARLSLLYSGNQTG